MINNSAHFDFHEKIQKLILTHFTLLSYPILYIFNLVFDKLMLLNFPYVLMTNLEPIGLDVSFNRLC